MKNESDSFEVIYCADDDEYRVYCEIATPILNDFCMTELL